jgi:cysteine sulfinate desulfinase/cysteine desulfurase-like protein
MQRNRIYLDAALGQPLSAAAETAHTSALKLGFGGSVAPHFEGKRSLQLAETAISTIAKSFNVDTSQVLPIHNLAGAISFLGDIAPPLHTSFSATSRSNLSKHLIERTQAKLVSVDMTGREIDEISAWHFTQAGNPETGVIANLVDLKAKSEVLVVDATEWVGRNPGLPVGDLVLVRANSFGGGNACFLISRTIEFKLTAIQRRSMAPSLAELTAAAVAIENQDLDIAESQRTWLSQFEAEISQISGLQLPPTGSILDGERRLPHLSTFMLERVEAEFLATALDKIGFAVGAGSACGLEPTASQTLTAMGIENLSNIRIGLPLSTRQSDLEDLLDVLPAAIAGS